MRVIIHAGTHKTATTSFQLICARNQRRFAQAGILYPLLAHPRLSNQIRPQHSAYARDLSRTTPRLTKKHFQRFLESASRNNLHTLLLSGEDFENILVDNRPVDNLLGLCEELGTDKPIIAFTIRDPYEYFCSIYSELSKKKVTIDFRQAALAASSTGYFAAPTEWAGNEHLSFNNFFAINSKGLIHQFKERHTDIEVIENLYTDFIRPMVGMNLISIIFGSTLAKSLDYTVKTKDQNKSLSKIETERNYTKHFLHLHKHLTHEDVEKVAMERLRLRQATEGFVKNLFHTSFPAFKQS